MGNHEFCTECGESDFHLGQPCDPKKKAAYQKSITPPLPPLPTPSDILQNMRQMSLADFRRRLDTLFLYAEGNAADREFYLKIHKLLQNPNKKK